MDGYELTIRALTPGKELRCRYEVTIQKALNALADQILINMITNWLFLMTKRESNCTLELLLFLKFLLSRGIKQAGLETLRLIGSVYKHFQMQFIPCLSLSSTATEKQNQSIARKFWEVLRRSCCSSIDDVKTQQQMRMLRKFWFNEKWLKWQNTVRNAKLQLL